MAADGKNVWYFGYGSNTLTGSMSKRRINPLKVQPVLVPSQYLTFDIFGIPYAEPAFASISTSSQRYTSAMGSSSANEGSTTATKELSTVPVHGVAYLLTEEDYIRLVLSEGSGSGYNEITVEAFPISRTDVTVATECKSISVRTLQAKYPFRPNRAPSARYMSLIIAGAIENGLPETYVQHLRSFPVYVPASARSSKFGAWLFLAFFQRAVRLLARSTKLIVDEEGHCPQAFGSIIVWFYWFMWACHDHVACSLWGRGDGVSVRLRSPRA